MSRKDTDEQDIKRMADLLRQGTTLTELACPACASPLFKLKNRDLWCAKCEKKVIVIKEGEDATRIQRSMDLQSLETMLLSKIQTIQRKMEHEENPEELQKLSTSLSGLFDNLEKLRNSRKALAEP